MCFPKSGSLSSPFLPRLLLLFRAFNQKGPFTQDAAVNFIVIGPPRVFVVTLDAF